MKNATVNFKVEESIKEQAFGIARMIGIPLGSILNAYLREFVNTKEVYFSNATVRKSRTVQQIVDNLDEDEKEALLQILRKDKLKRCYNNTDGAKSYTHN